VFNSIAHAVSDSFWSYLLVFGVCAGDAVLPLLPAETVVVAAAVLAANGHLNIALIVAAAALGALLGDNVAYLAGHGGLRRVADRFLKSGKNKRRLDWAREQLKRRGLWIIIIARFIPGGRSATTYAAGTLGMPWRTRFLPADAIAAALWAGYASALGYIGGAKFQHNLWLPLLIAAGVGTAVAAAGEFARRKLDRSPSR
jgi:membrane protein DedA with SNARE-associated domain